eukprot:2594606-Prymnesium_polylepis.1
MAPTCAGCDPEEFEDVCYFPDPRRRSNFRPQSLRDFLLELAEVGTRKVKPKANGGTGERRPTAPYRRQARYDARQVSNPFANRPLPSSGPFLGGARLIS